MRKFLLIGFTLLLTACVSSGPSDYLLGMLQYQGQSEAQLVDNLGPPDRTYEVAGTKYLSYTKASTQVFTDHPDYGLYGRDIGFSHSTDYGNIQTFRCDVFFAIRNNHVVKIGHRGNAC
jgi:hypothetical protein